MPSGLRLKKTGGVAKERKKTGGVAKESEAAESNQNHNPLLFCGWIRWAASLLVLASLMATRSEVGLMSLDSLTAAPSAAPTTPSYSAGKTFFLLLTPEISDLMLQNATQMVRVFYYTCLNEDQGELWLYRALQQHPSRTLDPHKADVYVVCGCLHLNDFLVGKQSPQAVNMELFASTILPQRIINASKPHLLAVPTTNPRLSTKIGIPRIMASLKNHGVKDLWSFGYERNNAWQAVPPSRIVPIPYVAKPPEQATTESESNSRTPNFVFFSGDRRWWAMELAGCDRQMVIPLALEPNMDVRISGNKINTTVPMKGRLSQEQYNLRMTTSDYCLIVCGDTPTSRSLASAVLFGCIPFFIGSRLRGLCEPPCHPGWGWTVSGIDNPHLPYSHTAINWSLFPEVNEAQFTANPVQVMHAAMDQFSTPQKNQLRAIMRQHRQGFIYGWGNPLDATQFGQVVHYAWESFWYMYQHTRDSGT